MADAANYMYEKASVKGVGYKNAEMIVSTKEGFNGSKLVEKESGSGNVITENTELEAIGSIANQWQMLDNRTGAQRHTSNEARKVFIIIFTGLTTVFWLYKLNIYKTQTEYVQSKGDPLYPISFS